MSILSTKVGKLVANLTVSHREVKRLEGGCLHKDKELAKMASTMLTKKSLQEDVVSKNLHALKGVNELRHQRNHALGEAKQLKL